MLPDLLKDNLSVVFCGTAAGTKSAQAKAYYAGPGNKFWKTLHEIGLTPTQLCPADFGQLLDHGLGLTDLVKCRAGADSTLSSPDFDLARFRSQILKHAPAFVCFNGKKAAHAYFGRQTVSYGLATETVGRTRLFVAPSTSGAANAYWDVSYWHALARLMRGE